jgi:hydrogenase maturation protease
MRCAAHNNKVCATSRILILGYGNPLRGDDGFGCHAARRLAAAIQDPNIEVRECHQLTPELAEPVSQAAHVILIDAAREGPVGELRREAVDPEAAGAFTHHLTPSGLMACARELYGRTPQATLFTAAGASFDYTMDLSDPVEAAVLEVCGQVLSLLQEL